MLDRGDYWQIAFVIAKGTAEAIRTAGLEHFRQDVVRVAPELADRVGGHYRLGAGEAADRARRSARRAGTSPGTWRSATPRTRCRRLAGSASTSRFRTRLRRRTSCGGRSRRVASREADLAEVQRRRERPVRLLQAFQIVRPEPFPRTRRSPRPRRRRFRWSSASSRRSRFCATFPPRLDRVRHRPAARRKSGEVCDLVGSQQSQSAVDSLERNVLETRRACVLRRGIAGLSKGADRSRCNFCDHEPVRASRRLGASETIARRVGARSSSHCGGIRTEDRPPFRLLPLHRPRDDERDTRPPVSRPATLVHHGHRTLNALGALRRDCQDVDRLDQTLGTGGPNQPGLIALSELPTADRRLPTADRRLPTADCRL